MADPIHYWRRALDCARKVTEATDEEEKALLFEMSEAWTNLAVVEPRRYEASSGGVDTPHIALIGLRRAVVMHRNLSSPERPPIRCDHCRKPFGLVLHRYFRMRFCSSDCLKAYQQRLGQTNSRQNRAPRSIPCVL